MSRTQKSEERLGYTRCVLTSKLPIARNVVGVGFLEELVSCDCCNATATNMEKLATVQRHAIFLRLRKGHNNLTLTMFFAY